MPEFIPQALGYLATLMLAISLMVNNDLRFRWLNTLGCLCFILYGLSIGAFPVILTNSLLLLINLFYLVKIYTAQEVFDLLEFKGEETLVKKFLSFYQKDIQVYFPAFKLEITENDIRFVVLRDLVIANMFIANLSADGTATVKLNYTVAKYRDYKVGKFIFDKEKNFLVSKGVKKILYTEVSHKGHALFLVKMGFMRQDNGSYLKVL